MTHEYCADFAELYALGALDDAERAAVEAHVRECAACAQLVAAAERDVALLVSMGPPHRAPDELESRIARNLGIRRSWPLPAAIAAALLIGLLPSAYFWAANATMHRTMLAQNGAIERLAVAPHRMARFKTIDGMPAAEVAYAPDGSWYFVVVHGASRSFSVAWMHDGERTMLGTTVARGDFTSLYLPQSHRMDRLALMDGDRIVAEATLTWQKTAPTRRDGRSA